MRNRLKIIISITFILFFVSAVHVLCASEKPAATSDQVILLESPGESTISKQSGLPDELTVKGFILLTGAWDIEKDSPEHDTTFRNRAHLEGKWSPDVEGASDAVGGDEFNYFILASAESDYLWFGTDRENDDHSFDLYEGYFFGLKEPFEFTIGKQIVRWGKTDQISPVDNLNPQDLRLFMVPEYEDRKIPNWMVRTRLYLDPLKVEGIYIPFFEPAKFDYIGTDWSVFRHLKASAQGAAIPPDLQQYIGKLRVDQQEPANTFENGQWGTRISNSVANWDLGLSYLYAWETLPFYESFPIGNIQVQGSIAPENLISVLPAAMFEPDPVIHTTFKRSHIIGFEFETTISDFGVRGEAAFYDDQSFLTDTITSVRKPVFQYILGVDYFWNDDWYFNTQFSHQVISDHDPSILFFNQHNTFLVGEISKEFWNGYFKAIVRYNIGLSEQSFYVAPELMCTYIPNLEITVGFNVLEGDSDTLIGFYEDNDQVFLKLKYYF